MLEVNFWIAALVGAMAVSPLMFMFGAEVTRRKIEDEEAEADWQRRLGAFLSGEKD